jgi:hypothetical protein
MDSLCFYISRQQLVYGDVQGKWRGQCEFLNCNIVEAGDGKWDIQRNACTVEAYCICHAISQKKKSWWVEQG